MNFELTEPITQLTDDNIKKYKEAGIICNKVLDVIVSKTLVGANIRELCVLGDQLIKTECDKVYPEIKHKGICFPTCLSLNETVGHFYSENDIFIKKDDLVKIELGVHIDGFPAIVGFTVYVKEKSDTVDKKKANVLKATIEASREILSLMNPDSSNYDVRDVLHKYADKYNCSLPVCPDRGVTPGDISYQVSRYVIDGQNEDEDQFIHAMIIGKDNEAKGFSLRECLFDEDEVYVIDVTFCTGEGRLNLTDETRIYCRDYQVREPLKLKSSKDVLRMFNDVFPKKMEKLDPKTRLGLKECVDKGILKEYPVVSEKKGEYTARIKFTVIVKDKPLLITGRPAGEQLNKL